MGNFSKYNWENIRELLIKGFDLDELLDFCYDNPDFKAVHIEIPKYPSQRVAVGELIKYSEENQLTEDLLTWAKERNPTRYEEHQPYYEKPQLEPTLRHLQTYLTPILFEKLKDAWPNPNQKLLTHIITHLKTLLKTISNHLPASLVTQLDKQSDPNQTEGAFINGTLLFAQIRGVTALSEQLSRVSKKEAERIPAIINRYFEIILNILQEHQGELINFSGNSLLGLFTQTDNATLATQAAWQMQKAIQYLAENESVAGGFPLQMSIGVHQGQFFAAQLLAKIENKYNNEVIYKKKYALFGPDVTVTAATQATAEMGQILLTPTTAKAISSAKVAPLSKTDAYLLLEDIVMSTPAKIKSPPKIPDFTILGYALDTLEEAVQVLNIFSPYLPTGLLSQLVNDGEFHNLTGESRLVAILSANVRGLDTVVGRFGVGQEGKVMRFLNKYFEEMMTVIYKYKGVVNKIDISTQGNKLLAFWGAPRAYEKDMEHTLHAALAMQTELKKVNAFFRAISMQLSQHIGITHGKVFAGYVGSSQRHEYTIMGDEVTLAADLMTVAESGQIIISSDVKRKVRALFELKAQGEITLKRHNVIMPFFSVEATQIVPARLRDINPIQSPLVGREVEWKHLHGRLAWLGRGKGQIVSIIGEAGLGKSRLLAEIHQEMAEETPPRYRWIEGRCLSHTETINYHPFRQMLHQIIDYKETDSTTEALANLWGVLETRFEWDELEAIIPYLAKFLGLPLEDEWERKVYGLDEEALQRQTFLAIKTLLKQEAKATFKPSPLILVLEDMHWLDWASIELLKFLLPLVKEVPVMFLLLYRPEDEWDFWKEIHTKKIQEFKEIAFEISLEPLAQPQSETLLTNLVATTQWPAKDLMLILNRAQGNPLFLEQIIHWLIDQNILTEDETGKWQLQSTLLSIGIPDTLQKLMTSRLDQLSVAYRQVAQIASVIGQEFSFDMLTHLLSVESTTVNDYLIHLQQREIVYETRREPDVIYAFKHALMQQACYNSLLLDTRISYHARIAAYMEETHPISHREIEETYPLIAYHAFLGETWPRALRYQILTGQQNQKSFANKDAIENFEKALECVTQLPEVDTLKEQQIIHGALGELYTTTDKYDFALEHLNKAYALAVEQGDDEAEVFVCLWMAQLYERRAKRDDYSLSLNWIQQGLAKLSDFNTITTARLFFLASLVHHRQGDYDQATDQCQKALQVAENFDEVTPVLASAYRWLGTIALVHGKNLLAVKHCNKALDIYIKADDILGQSRVYNELGIAYSNLGEWPKAENYYYQAVQIYHKMGDIYHEAFTNNNLGYLAFYQGRLDEALAIFQACLRAIKEIGGSLWIQGMFHNNLGAVYIRSNEVDLAQHHLYIAKDYFTKADARNPLPELYRLLAETALLTGDLAEARKHGLQALELAQELSMVGEEGLILRVLGEIATVEGEFSLAEKYFEQSLSHLRQVKDIYGEARTQLSLAKLYAIQRKPELGLTLLEKCIKVFERLGATLDLDAAYLLQEELKGH